MRACTTFSSSSAASPARLRTISVTGKNVIPSPYDRQRPCATVAPNERAATSCARRVLPTPAAPKTVTSRHDCSSSAVRYAACRTSRSGPRPTRGESRRRKIRSAPARTSSRRQLLTGSLLPLSENDSSGPARTRSATSRCVSRPSRISPGCAACWRRAATLTASPVAIVCSVVGSPTTTSPVLIPIRSSSRTPKRSSSSRVQPRQRAPHLVGRAHCPERVVLVDDRDAEDGHHGVADELLDSAAVPFQHGAHLVEVADHHPPHRLRVHALAEAREARDVAEQDGDRLANERFGPVGHALTSVSRKAGKA